MTLSHITELKLARNKKKEEAEIEGAEFKLVAYDEGSE